MQCSEQCADKSIIVLIGSPTTSTYDYYDHSTGEILLQTKRAVLPLFVKRKMQRFLKTNLI